MSVLETVTVDNVTYDIHDPKVGSGTLQTTAQTLIPAVNELKTGVAKTDVIGSGSLNTTSQTLIGAVNELNGKLGIISDSGFSSNYTATVPNNSGNGQFSGGYLPFQITKPCIFVLRPTYSSNVSGIWFGTSTTNGRAIFLVKPADGNSSVVPGNQGGYSYTGVGASTTANYYTHVLLLFPGDYCFGAYSAWGGTITVNYARFYFN